MIESYLDEASKLVLNKKTANEPYDVFKRLYI